MTNNFATFHHVVLAIAIQVSRSSHHLLAVSQQNSAVALCDQEDGKNPQKGIDALSFLHLHF